jgi:hypothetical protein
LDFLLADDPVGNLGDRVEVDGRRDSEAVLRLVASARPSMCHSCPQQNRKREDDGG